MLSSNKASYRTITNDAGKLPESWEEDRRRLLVRVAYMIFKHNIKPDLFVNMDETPLMLVVPSKGTKTWAIRGSSHVAVTGAKDKRQITGTPWINYKGEIVLFHTTSKGKTAACLPKNRHNVKFKQPVKFVFGYSDNHWVSKQTMRVQVNEIERYRRRVCVEKKFPLDSKLLILWDVYCRHRDQDLMKWIKSTFENIFVLFVPANLTEICQPLDRGLNKPLKDKLVFLRNQRNAEATMASMGDIAGGQISVPTYVPSTKLSDIKEPFFDDLAMVVKALSTPEKQQRFSTVCWQNNLFEKCFDIDFQRQCMRDVIDDKDCKYFSSKEEDPLIDDESNKLFKIAADFFENLADNSDAKFFNGTPNDARNVNPSSLLGKAVEPLGGPGGWYAGYVTEYNGHVPILGGPKIVENGQFVCLSLFFFL